ncbi:MAG: hypothetical protein JF570_02435 [Caulobacter sp.]|nr:hypothetical protein [Caulobacter sp.]
MKTLFDGKYAPITDMIGFIRCSPARAADLFVEWQRPIQGKRGVSVDATSIKGSLEASLRRLAPLTSVERRRYLFIPTRSNWTAFLDNGHQGTDAFSPLSYMAEKLSCEAVRATYDPETRDGSGLAVIWELYGPHVVDFSNTIRAVFVANDGNGLIFSESGEAQPYEDVEKYSSRLKRNRFTPQMLDHYLRAVGIEAFDENFYQPEDQAAILVEKRGPIAPASREFQLADLQGS